MAFPKVSPASATRLILAAALLAIAAPAGAQPAPTPLAVDAAASRVWTFVDKGGLVGHVHAVEGRLSSGWIAPGARERAGELVFDMRSFRADTPDARRALRLDGEVDANTQQQTNDNMLGPQVLDVARHPTASFQIDSALLAPAQPGKPPAYDLVGAFTLHGARRPLTVRAQFEDLGDAVRLVGMFPIRQTEFGIKPFAKFGGVVAIADELKIWGDIRIPKAVPRPAAAPPHGQQADPVPLRPESNR